MCHFFSWSYQETLAMPIRAFFKMYEQAMKMEAAQYREYLDISMAPSMKFTYYKMMRGRYNSIIDPSSRELPSKPSNMHLEASSKDAKDVMFGLFRAVKRGLGYG